MKIIKPYHEILAINSRDEIMNLLETAGRTCYQSEPKGNPDEFVRKIIASGHLSIIEHPVITARLVCDRGVMAELTRHRIGVAFSIESTRFCRYSDDKFDNQVTFILPPWHEDEIPVGEYSTDSKDNWGKPAKNKIAWNWFSSMLNAEEDYLYAIENGASPQEARSVLPNSTKTTIIMTANLREMKHIFNLRCSKAAHPQIRQLFLPLLDDLYNRLPVIFEQEYTCFRIKGDDK